MLLVALSGWNVGQWVERLQKKMPGREIVALGEPAGCFHETA